jgi:hypothetical protein
MHVKEISRLFDLNDDESTAADIEVLFARQSGHRLIECGTSFGIDAAYPSSLQQALLKVYRWMSSRWHDFLKQSRELSEGAGLDSSIPARQYSISMKRHKPGADDEHEPKRLGVNAVPMDNTARPK